MDEDLERALVPILFCCSKCTSQQAYQFGSCNLVAPLLSNQVAVENIEHTHDSKDNSKDNSDSDSNCTQLETR